MNKPALICFLAVAIGLGGAATALYVLKPQDRPIALPGADVPVVQVEPPVLVPLGAQSASQRIHLVLGDDHEASKAAYRLLMDTLASSSDLGGNVIPAGAEDGSLHRAFGWVLAAGPDRQTVLDALMGLSGEISDSALTVIAQNAGLDAASLGEKAKSPAVQDALAQARSVLPPSTPAFYINGKWLTGMDLSPSTIAQALGRAETAAETAPATLVVEQPYAFATAPKAQLGAAFFTLRNPGNAAISITKAESPVSPRIELHGHTMDENGVMAMRPVQSIDIPAGGSVTLQPTGLHLMLFDLPAPLAVGQNFPLTLTLSDGQAISTLVSVVPPGQAPQGDSAPALTYGHH